MNRADRRRMAKQKGFNITNFPKGEEQHDRKKDIFCYRHPLKLDDPKNPTSERDKRLTESVRYQQREQTLEDGRVRLYKVCPRCFDQVEIDIIERALIPD